jgi:hypothetical protein
MNLFYRQRKDGHVFWYEGNVVSLLIYVKTNPVQGQLTACNNGFVQKKEIKITKK